MFKEESDSDGDAPFAKGQGQGQGQGQGPVVVQGTLIPPDERALAKAQKAKAREDESAARRVEEIALLRTRLVDSTVLVLPGDVVHMYRDNGILAASHCDHRFPTFREVTPMLCYAVL
jgi:hypothetical protein